MITLDQNDLYQVKFASLVADYDRRTIIDLYMPIAGYIAISIYFKLWCEAEQNSIDKLKTHADLLISMQLSTGKFIKERKKLEALGLLKTNIMTENEINIYTYRIYAPKTPYKFFEHTLYYGTLIKYIGEPKANLLKQKYLIDKEEDFGLDITETFASMFSPDFTNPIFKKALEIKKGEVLDRIQSEIDTEFNYKIFLDYIKESGYQINLSIFTKKVLKEIERLCGLYGIKEDTAAEYVTYCYDPDAKGINKINFTKLNKMFQDDSKFPFLRKDKPQQVNKIVSDTAMAKNINMMEEISCKDFLRILQGDTKPVESDLNIINDLSYKLQLLPPVINAIIQYTLQKCDNVFVRSFAEKVGASVAREGLTTAYDTMVYLNKKRFNKPKDYEFIKSKTENYSKTSIKEEKPAETDDVDEKEFLERMAKFGG